MTTKPISVRIDGLFCFYCIDNAKYNTTLESVTVTSDDVATYTKGMTCTPEMKNGKTYDITEFTCTVKVIIANIDIFEATRKVIGKFYDVVVKFENNKATFSNQLGYTFVKSSSFWGCFQGWSLTLLIIFIIIVIAAIVFAVIAFTKKGKGKQIPKKTTQ